MNRHKMVLALAATLVLLVSLVGTVSAAATITPSTDTPIIGEEITFTVGTTLEGLEATISTTGLTYVSNTGLGNTTHAITVPGVGTAYTYRVTAEEGETVSFILSDVQEADDQGNELPGQRVTWMAAAQRAAAPTESPSQEPTQQPSDQPSQEPTATPAPTQAPSQQPSDQPSQQPTATPAPSGNPSPTINPSQSVPPATTGGTSSGGGTTGGTTGGGTTGGTTGGGPPRTGDISHFWMWVGIGAILTPIIIAAGKRVFAD